MILEHAILPVREGQEAEFEAAFELARPLISSQQGSRSLSLSRSIESPNLYMLLVEWDDVESHTDGFRTSADYRAWKGLLHHFYESSPSSSTSQLSPWGDPPGEARDRVDTRLHTRIASCTCV